MPDYQNPTNHIMTLSCRRMIAETAQERDLLLIEDGINSLFAANPLPPVASLAPEHCIFLLSLSKTVLPALRLAYLQTPLRWAAALEQALYHINLSQSSLLLEIASRLTLSGRLEHLLAGCSCRKEPAGRNLKQCHRKEGFLYMAAIVLQLGRKYLFLPQELRSVLRKQQRNWSRVCTY